MAKHQPERTLSEEVDNILAQRAQALALIEESRRLSLYPAPLTEAEQADIATEALRMARAELGLEPDPPKLVEVADKKPVIIDWQAAIFFGLLFLLAVLYIILY